ncbi:MAG: GyrI-like domain-containing protein [Bacteroidales bacterium]
MISNGFKVIGISTRTTNEGGQSQSDLGNLWQKFYSENILHRIPDKVSDDVISIYTDYKSDFTGEYTAIVGAQVTSLDHIPEGMNGREFDAEKFKKYTSKGPMPEAVVNTWIEIWQKDKQLNRKYSYDFEVYGAKSQNGDNSEVDIYISIF